MIVDLYGLLYFSLRHSMCISINKFMSGPNFFLNGWNSSFFLPVLIVDHFSCVDYDMHKTPTWQDWPSQRLVTKCLEQSSCGFVLFVRDWCVQVRIFSHQLWILWHFSLFLHCSKSTVHYYYWLVMVSPVAVMNNYFLWFRLLDIRPIHAIVIVHNQLGSILVVCGLFPLNIDSMWDTKCTETQKKKIFFFVVLVGSWSGRYFLLSMW